MNAQILSGMFAEANLNLKRIHAWGGESQVEQLPRGLLKRKIPVVVSLGGHQNLLPTRTTQLDRHPLPHYLFQSNVDMSRKGTADEYTFLNDKLGLTLR
jgi:hypothetical protein